MRGVRPSAAARAQRRRAALVARVLALGLMLLVGLGGPAGEARADDDEAAPERELDALREAIANSRERVGDFERSERDLLEVLEDIDRQSTRLRSDVRLARRKADAARDALEAIRPRVVEAARRLERTRAAMRARAVALYKAGEVGPVRVLFSSTSLQDLLVRARALRMLLDADLELVERFDLELAALEQVEREATEARDARSRAVTELAERERRLEAERVVRSELLARARTDRTRERALLVELERAARALEEKLETLSERSAEGFDGTGFGTLQGALPTPVGARIVAPFGRVVDDEFGTETFRKGVEFGATAGDRVTSVAPGAVRFAGWFRGYGRIVIVDHGEGYFSVSGHLDEVYVDAGDQLETGDTLGTVGETGSLTGPSLYFELRAEGEPLDPEGWFGAPARS